MPTPEVSVVIASYNGAARIGLQLEALATQSDAPPFEVIEVLSRAEAAGRLSADGWRELRDEVLFSIDFDEQRIFGPKLN